MLLKIHNFQYNTQLSEIRKLLLEKCGLSDLVLDNFVAEGNTKRITVGVADEVDGALLVRTLNGLFYNGKQLYVEHIRQKSAEQPYNPRIETAQATANTSERSQYGAILTNTGVYQQPQYIQNANPSVGPFNQRPNVPLQTPYSNMPFYMTPIQNSYSYGTKPATVSNTQGPDYGQPNTAAQSQWQTYTTDMYQRRQESKQAPQSSVSLSDEKSHFMSNKTWDNKESHGVGYQGPQKRNRSVERSYGYDDKSGYNDGHTPQRSDRNQYQNQTNWDRKSFDGRHDGYKDEKEQGFKRHKPDDVRRPGYDKPDTSLSRRLDRSPPRDRYFEKKPHDRSAYSWSAEPRSGAKPNDFNNRPETLSRPYGNTPGNSTFDKTKEFSHGGYRSNFGDKKKKFDRTYTPPKPKNKPKPNTNNFNNQPNADNKKSRKTLDGTKEGRRRQCRAHSCAILTKEVLQNSDKIQCKGYVRTSLKTCILARLDSIQGDKTIVNLKEMLRLYRSKFKPEEDPAFYAAVRNKAIIKHKEKVAATEMAEDGKILLARPEQYQAASTVVPKYPNDDKKSFMKQKQEQFFLEMQDDHVYALDAPLRKALDQEMEVLADVFANSCSQSPEKFDAKLAQETLAKFKKVMDLHVTKRLLNICNGLQLRIFFHPKAPPKPELEEFLKKYDISSLKKSVKKKMYIASCSTFKGFDELCTLNTAVIGPNTLEFKPLHITGLPEKKLKAKAKKLKAQQAKKLLQNSTNADKESDQSEVDDLNAENSNLNKAQTATGGKNRDEEPDVVLVVPPASEKENVIIIDDCEITNASGDKIAQHSDQKDDKKDGSQTNVSSGNEPKSTDSKTVTVDDSDWNLNGAEPEENWDIENKEETSGVKNDFDNIADMASVDFTEDDLEDF